MFYSKRAFAAYCLFCAPIITFQSSTAQAIQLAQSDLDAMTIEEACDSEEAVQLLEVLDLREEVCKTTIYECDVKYEVKCKDGTTTSGRSEKKKNKNKTTATRQAQDSAQSKANDFCGGADKVDSVTISDTQCTP